MSLTSRLQALLTFANEKTEAGDTTIGAAIKTLCDGYSGASGSATYPTITDADTLSSRIQALIAYADDTTGVADATLAEAIKRLVKGYGSKPWTKYVQDGLVFQLDCETQCSADTWTDLIGGIVFNGSGMTLDGGVPTFNGSNSYYETGSSLKYGTESTIELVIVPDASNVAQKQTMMILTNTASNLLGASLADDSSEYNLKLIHQKQLGVHYASNMCISFNTNVCVCDGNLSTIAATGGFGVGTKVNIGRRNNLSSYYYKGKIYAIRIYNRLLSADEMIANQAIDIERFQNK